MIKTQKLIVTAINLNNSIVDEIAKLGDSSISDFVNLSEYTTSSKALQRKQSGFPTTHPTPRPRPPWHGLNIAMERRDLATCLNIAEAVSPASDPIDTLNHFNPRFACPRCGMAAEIIERNRRYLKLRCPRCGCFLKWVGGKGDA